MNDYLKQGLAEDDISIIASFLESVYWARYSENPRTDSSEEELKIVIECIGNKLRPIAEKHGITAEFPQEVSAIKSDYAKYKVQCMSKNTEFGDSTLPYNVKFILDDAREYMANFVSNTEQIRKLLSNPDLKSETELLQEKWAELDSVSPQDKPQNVRKNPSQDWEWDWVEEVNEEDYRLETPEEVQERLKKLNLDRQAQLDAVKNIDNMEIFQQWWNFINVLPSLTNLYADIKDSVNNELYIERDALLNSFTEDESFFNQAKEIMEHDEQEAKYWYHGTQSVEDAESIMSEGLFMASDKLDSTAYAEFTPEQLLTYKRGFMGEVGRDAIVVIKQPIITDSNGKLAFQNIVTDNTTNINVVQSGLGGFRDKIDYMIPPEYIVGVINKRDHQVILNKVDMIDDTMSM